MSEGFLLQQNIDILWEIIEDNEIIQNNNPIQKEKIVLFFRNMVREFYQREKDNYPQLMNMNKAFITTFFTVLNTHYNAGNKKQTSQTSGGLITHEQLQEKRLNEFDKDLERRKQEFTNAMTMSVPEQPKFNDEKDRPIEEIEFMVKQMAAMREMELSTINNNMNMSKQDAEKWLQAKETSVKNDKYVSPTKEPGKVYIQITDEPIETNLIKKEIIDLNKQLTWGKDQVQHISLLHENSKPFLEEENNFAKPKDPFIPNQNQNQNQNQNDNELEKQIKQLSNTLEAHMEKCNNTLSIIYSLLVAKKTE
jgi:hypothetical protein